VIQRLIKEVKMDNLTFIAELLKAFAWPITLLIILLIFRKSIAARIPGINKLKFKDFELEFNKQLSAVKHEIEVSTKEEVWSTTEEQEDDSTSDIYASIAEVSPRAAILESWIGFETTAVSSARALNLIKSKGPVSFPNLLRILLKNELINSKEESSITKLRTLRNQVVLESNVNLTKESAVEYAWIIREIAEEIARRTWSRLPGD
jgi:hypothetical protein